MDNKIVLKKERDLNFSGVKPCPLCGSDVTRFAILKGKAVECIAIVWKYKHVGTSVLALWLAMASPCLATTYNFSGTLADGGNVTGSWDDAGWSAFTLNPLYGGLPVQDAVVTRFCPSNCPFFGGSTSILFATGSQSTLRLVFNASLATFDPNSSWVESWNVDGSPHSLIMVRTGAFSSESPPISTREPSTLWLFGLAMGLGLALKMKANWIGKDTWG